MALSRSTVYKGIEANYLKIINVTQNFLDDTATVQLALYLNDKAREANVDNYLEVEQRFLTAPGSASLDRAGIYTALKLLPAYQDATDC